MADRDYTMPKGWKKTTLGEVAEITSSKRIFAKEYLKSGIPFYRGKEIIEKFHGHPVSTDLFISDEKYNEIKNKFGVPKPGEMLLTSVGTLGIPYIVNEGEKFYFKDGNLTWFKDFDNINNIFLFYWIISDLGKEQLARHTIGSTQQALTIVGLKSISISLPPLPEQAAIALVLTSLENKINLLREQNRTIESTAQTIFKEWFVNFNFPGATGKMVDSEFGEIPEGWRVGKLANLVDLTIGRTPPRKEPEWFSLSPKDVNWLSIKDLGEAETYVLRTSEFLTQRAIDKHRMHIVPKDTVVISFKLTVGRVAITLEEMTTNEAIAHLRLSQDSEVTAEFLYLFFKVFDFNSIGSTSSIATAFNSKSLRVLDVLVPAGNVIQKFDQAIKPIFKKIANNICQVQTLSSLRDTLLPKLMKGEVRVKGFSK